MHGYRIEIADGPPRLLSRIDALRLIDDDGGVRRFNEFDGAPSQHAVAFAVDDVELLHLVSRGTSWRIAQLQSR